MVWIDLPVGEMAARYEAGESTRMLGRAYGVSPRTISGRLRVAGVKIRPQGAPRGNGNGSHRPGGPLFAASGGYLCTYDREGKSCRVHRGCWEAYRGEIPHGYIVHHIDGDRLNNAIGNLSCMTPGEHMRLHAEGRRGGWQ